MTFNKETRAAYLAFACASDARWAGNFRDLSASVTRMATFAPSGRIDPWTVTAEVARLQRLWGGEPATPGDGLDTLFAPDALAALDPFDRVQLAEGVRVARASRSLSEAGRKLFSVSRARRGTPNDGIACANICCASVSTHRR